MRIKRIINWGILFGYNTKFSGLANKEMYGCQLGELTFRSGSERVKSDCFGVDLGLGGLGS